MKGIVLAGGSGTRLHPITKSVSKQLLPIYDKPMIYYPVSTLMLLGIHEILIITTKRDLESFKSLLGDGTYYGISIEYALQESPKGIAEAFLIGEDFIGTDKVCLILGDNIFYGSAFLNTLREKLLDFSGALITAYRVNNPGDFGVVEFINDKVISIEEKPVKPKSNFAIPGIYFYDHSVVEIAKKISPSHRGELEITSVNQEYLSSNRLGVVKIGRGVAWLDTGSPESLLTAAEFIRTVQNRQGLFIGSIEEIAWRMNYIDNDELLELANKLGKTDYGQYLVRLLKDLN